MMTQQAWAKKLTVIAVVAFTIYLAHLLAQSIWYLVDDRSSPVPVSMAATGSTATSERRVARSIESYHLFGEVNQAEVVREKPKEAPKTRLRLLLKGVFTGEDGGQSGAIIEEIGRSAEYYKLGDAVPGNATLSEVYPDRVLLERAGRYETLFFEEVSTSSIDIAESRPEPRTQVKSPEDFIEEATSRLNDDPERALNSVGLTIAQEGGYAFTGNNPMLSGMNLQRGDVIRSVNGHTLGDVDQDKEMLRSLAEQGSVEVEVVRDGASFFINYPLR